MVATDLEVEINYIKEKIELEESKFLSKLQEIDYDNLSLEQQAIAHKNKVEKFRADTVEKQDNQYKPDEELLNIKKVSHKNELKEYLAEERRILDLIASLKTPLDVYKACLTNKDLLQHTPVYVCANDYIQEQVLLFEKENNLKHFRLDTINTYVNRLNAIVIPLKNRRNSMPNEFRYIELKSGGLVVDAEKITAIQPTTIHSDYQKHINTINKSLRNIEELTRRTESFRIFKILAGKSKRETLNKYYAKSIEQEKKHIYETYSKLLFIKDDVDILKVEKNTERLAIEKEEKIVELVKISEFMNEKLLFKMEVKGIK